MRTTLEIDDDVLAAARQIAAERHESLGTVVSSLIRAGLRPADIDVVDGLPIIRARPGATLITPQMIDSALDDPSPS